MVSRLYLYGVIPCSDPVNLEEYGIGDDQAKVYTVPYQDLAMVVSNIDMGTVDPSRKNALCHEQVLSAVMQQYAVIPCAFGTVVKDAGKITTLLERQYEDLKKTFLKISHKVELGLKVFWKKEFFQHLPDAYPDLQKLSREIAQAGAANCYDKKIQLGELVEKRVEEKRQYYLDVIFQDLSQLAVEAKSNKTLGINMVFNAAFLVDKDKETDFDRRVEKLYEQVQQDVMFNYSGPWPPHNFVDLLIGGED
ncbi:GvpL/GvpF family gas vesicle protein [Candidatus Formimonas warabiya]|uniref:GvpL/GvpF family gas vesicle protein n=1 Tax=Formimonas warabiya TaxID=1761012 RepID=A0A3G1KWP0_FORW1|nr:GvpL/GvpF family gas vesicle protein [Candidatus Formimonas warabiya]ATW26953.1 hypothetical protein DCMF_21270 [Candidatus Formimonas warabiya]